MSERETEGAERKRQLIGIRREVERKDRERERELAVTGLGNPHWFNYIAFYDLGGLLDRSISS